MPFRTQTKRVATKYGNQKVGCTQGHSHRSKLEASVCQILFLREKAKEIVVLQVEDHIKLSDAEIVYVADFKCMNLHTSELFWVEAKGFAAPTWPIKKKLWKFYGPGKLEIWTGHYNSPTLSETIAPKTKSPLARIN